MTPRKLSTMKRTTLVLALALSQTITLAPLMVLAADSAVRVAGQTVIVNKASGGGLSVDQRAEVIQRNLDNALVAAKDRTPASVNIVYVKGMPVVTLGGYQIVTVDADNAKAYGTTPALLAQKWADGLRGALGDKSSIDSYVAQLSGDYQSSAPQQTSSSYSPPQQQAYTQPPQGGYGAASGGYGAPQGGYGGPPGGYGGPAQQYGATQAGYPQGAGGYAPTGGGYPMQRGRVVYAPAGLTMPISLQTSISTQVARAGDMVQATINNPVSLGDATIPAGSTVIGTVVDAKSGGFLGRAGMLGIKFNRLRTTDGAETPISAHIVGGIGKYTDVGNDESDTVRGETWKTKVGQAGIRGALGAGTGAALGTAIGAIAARSGRGAGRGAWSGAAIGGGAGVAQSLLLRRGKEVTIASGTQMQLQLDAPVSISAGGAPPYTGAF